MADDPSRMVDKIWSDWYNGDGPCENCPGRDKSGCYSPYYGAGTLSAKIAFVGETPGDSRPTQTQNPNDPCWDSVSKNHAKETHGLDWLFGHPQIPEKFFNRYLGAEYGFNPSVENGIYFTNAKKCADIVGADEGWKDEKARIDCRSYLKPEIEAVDPSVIVSFGTEATKSLYRIFDVDRNAEILAGEVLNTYGVNDRFILPSYHWSGLQRNISNLKSVSDADDYWKVLADEITAIVEQETP